MKETRSGRAVEYYLAVKREGGAVRAPASVCPEDTCSTRHPDAEGTCCAVPFLRLERETHPPNR